MSATRAEGVLSWNWSLVASSIVIGVGLGALALSVAVGFKGMKRWLIGSMLLTASICGLHFTGMGAVVLTPESGVNIPRGDLSGDALALRVGATTAALIVLCFGALLLEQRMARRADRRIRELADSAVEGLLICQSGAVVTANASLARLLGLPADQIVGMSLAEMLGDGLAEACLTPGSTHRREGVMSAANGEQPRRPGRTDPDRHRLAPRATGN